jgi:hypothetical protein
MKTRRGREVLYFPSSFILEERDFNAICCLFLRELSAVSCMGVVQPLFLWDRDGGREEMRRIFEHAGNLPALTTSFVLACGIIFNLNI